MAEYKYAFQGFNKELMARAVIRDGNISTKQGIEICNYLRHRKLAQAKALLTLVMEKKQAIPFKRFTNGLGHKPGMSSGRYPIKAAEAFLKLFEGVEANAQSKGLNTGELEIIHLCTHKSANQSHYGRSAGRHFKKSNVEVVVQETPKKEKGKKETKQDNTKQDNTKSKKKE